MPSISLGDAEIHYEVTGDGPPIVFVQGVGVAGCGWSPQVEDLSNDHRCIVIDNRGIGGSRGETKGLTVDVMARDALAVLDALGLARAHLVGHSLGGVIVQRMALIGRERARSLSFLCTFAGGADLRGPSARLMWLGLRSRVGTLSMRRRAFARLVMPDDYLDARGIDRAVAELEAVFGRSLGAPPQVVGPQLAALRGHDERSRLGELSAIPALVMSGAFDPIARPAAGRAVAEGIGTARYVEWDDASHALPIQHASRVNAMLREHFAAA